MGFPGVPPLLSQPPSTAGSAAEAQDVPGLTAAQVDAVQWGIYLNGKAVLLADSVVSFDYRNESRVSDYPQEEGAFQSYNKVATPYHVRVKMSKGGKAGDRQVFLQTLEKISHTTDLYMVVTPERTYANANITGYDYSRTASHGAGMIVAEIILEEIRVTAQAAFSNTQQPSGANPVFAGTKQPQPAPPATIAAVSSAGASGDW